MNQHTPYRQWIRRALAKTLPAQPDLFSALDDAERNERKSPPEQPSHGGVFNARQGNGARPTVGNARKGVKP